MSSPQRSTSAAGGYRAAPLAVSGVEADEIERQLDRELADSSFDQSIDVPEQTEESVPAWSPPAQMNPEVPKTAEETESDKQRQKMLIISFVAMVVVGLGNRIFNVLQFIPMNNYPLWINMMTTYVYLPACFFYIWPMLKWGKYITPEALNIPKYKFAVMGCLDAVAGIMQSLAVNYIANGSLVTLLMQAAVPVSMIISKIFLRTKYTVWQYGGALVVGGGLATVLVPVFVQPDDDDSNNKGENVGLWSVIMIASMIPQCLSSVYKEKALGEVEIDVVYLNGWVAVFQFLASIPLLVPSAPASNLAISDIPSNLWDGTKCFVGINSITTGKHPDDCAMSAIYVSVYLVFNIAYNILIIMILKYGSSNLLWLAMTVMVPLGNVSFALDFMPDPKALHWYDIVGLLLILSGLIVYRFAAKLWKRIEPCILRFIFNIQNCVRRLLNRPPLPEVLEPLLVPVAPSSPFLFGPAPGTTTPTTGSPALGTHHSGTHPHAAPQDDSAASSGRSKGKKSKMSSRATQGATRPINAETP